MKSKVMGQNHRDQITVTVTQLQAVTQSQPTILKISAMVTDSICRDLRISTTGKTISQATNNELKVPSLYKKSLYIIFPKTIFFFSISAWQCFYSNIIPVVDLIIILFQWQNLLEGNSRQRQRRHELRRAWQGWEEETHQRDTQM